MSSPGFLFAFYRRLGWRVCVLFLTSAAHAIAAPFAYIVAVNAPGVPPAVVRVIDTATNLDAEPLIPLPAAATGPVAISPNGAFLYVLANDRVFQIDLRSRSLTAISLPFATATIALSPDGRRLYGGGQTGQNNVFKIDLISGALDVTSFPGGAIFGIPLLAVAADGTVYAVHSAVVYQCWLDALDPATLQAKWGGVSLSGTSCTGLAVSPDGRFVYSSGGAGPHFTWAHIMVVSTEARAVVNSLDLGVDGLEPGPIALSHDGRTLYSVNGNHDLFGLGTGFVVVDTATLTLVKNIAISETAASPGVALTPDGSFAYITNGDAGTVSVVDTNKLGPPFVLPQFGNAISSGNFVGPPTVQDAVEYYNAKLDHYFVTSLDAEVAALDSGATVGWSRTGQSFGVYPAGTATGWPVCRFYIPPAFGDSHFYSASATECIAVGAKFPALQLESAEVFRIDTPDVVSGACPPGDVPIYRVWNQRKDSNHRYTTSLDIRDAMVAKGYVAEGYGPNAVALCAPH